ncbi:Rossmann-like and DUF2520 domain-containing protein [Acinetobacter sp. MD2]|uniref:Rossmann-like and DUF2520 domain-containing protein n=1 Tax=Acinetobacter sp. MD2 TaxID=2600066 RepID=UPI002D1F0DF3|nr:DUF2520 domain-containing protein [Acinetobacter sp. MD2]MEB3766439.1 DUF2520 domain-containing protein [Acinetobacter sp. MD2]
MKISFVGSGRVATHLSAALQQQGHQIMQICSPKHAAQLAQKYQAQAVSCINDLNADIDVLIISVSDQAIATVITALPRTVDEVCVLHTSGSTDIQILLEHHAHSGVLYPLQTFSLEKKVNWSEIPLLIEGSTLKVQNVVTQLANSLSNKVYHYSSSQRLSLHLAAVFACNFSNYCYDMADQITEKAQIDFSLLHPLILETAQKATQFKPKDVQTGPAKRQDQNILALHQQLLQQQQRTDLAEIYQTLSEGIIKQAN